VDETPDPETPHAVRPPLHLVVVATHEHAFLSGILHEPPSGRRRPPALGIEIGDHHDVDWCKGRASPSAAILSTIVAISARPS